MYNIFCQAIAPVGQKTETAGTAIYKLIDPRNGLKTVIQRLTVETGATAHTLTVMRPIEKVLTSAAAEKDQKVIDIDEDPGSIASNDYCVVRLADGTYQLNKVDSVSTLEITFTDNWNAAVESGAPVWFMGVVGDDHAQYTLAADSENTFEAEAGYFTTESEGQPMVLSIDNGTNASTIQGGLVIYVNA